MMKQNVFFLVFVLIVVAFFGYWVAAQVLFPSSSKTTDQQQAALSLENRTNPVFKKQEIDFQPINWLNSANQSTSPEVFQKSNYNMTEKIAADLSKDFIAKYSSGQTSTPPVDEIIKKYTSSGNLSDFNVALEFDKPILDSKLKIIKDNSPSAKQKYLDEMGSVVISNFQYVSESTFKKAVEDLFEKDDYSMVQKIAQTSYDVVDKLTQISVPSSLLLFHKNLLRSFDNIAYFFTLMVNYKEDPLKVMAAIDYFPKVIEEGKTISTQLDQIIKSSNN